VFAKRRQAVDLPTPEEPGDENPFAVFLHKPGMEGHPLPVDGLPINGVEGVEHPVDDEIAAIGRIDIATPSGSVLIGTGGTECRNRTGEADGLSSAPFFT
jgi:hypothetical protein